MKNKIRNTLWVLWLPSMIIISGLGGLLGTIIIPYNPNSEVMHDMVFNLSAFTVVMLFVIPMLIYIYKHRNIQSESIS